MVFNNVASVSNHINNQIDSSVFPEERHNILQGNIGTLVAGQGRLFITDKPNNSILGIAGDVMHPSQILYNKNQTDISQTGNSVNVPVSIFDDKSPFLYGENGFGVNWNNLEVSREIGYNLDFKNNRTLNFPYSVNSSVPIGPMPHSPPINLKNENNTLTPQWEPIPLAYPGLGTPINNCNNNLNKSNFK